MASGNSLSGVDVFGDAFSGIPAMGIFWKIGFEECKFSADWFSGREIFFGSDCRSSSWHGRSTDLELLESR